MDNSIEATSQNDVRINYRKKCNFTVGPSAGCGSSLSKIKEILLENTEKFSRQSTLTMTIENYEKKNENLEKKGLKVSEREKYLNSSVNYSEKRNETNFEGLDQDGNKVFSNLKPIAQDKIYSKHRLPLRLRSGKKMNYAKNTENLETFKGNSTYNIRCSEIVNRKGLKWWNPIKEDDDVDLKEKKNNVKPTSLEGNTSKVVSGDKTESPIKNKLSLTGNLIKKSSSRLKRFLICKKKKDMTKKRRTWSKKTSTSREELEKPERKNVVGDVALKVSEGKIVLCGSGEDSELENLDQGILQMKTRDGLIQFYCQNNSPLGIQSSSNSMSPAKLIKAVACGKRFPSFSQRKNKIKLTMENCLDVFQDPCRILGYAKFPDGTKRQMAFDISSFKTSTTMVGDLIATPSLDNSIEPPQLPTQNYPRAEKGMVKYPRYTIHCKCKEKKVRCPIWPKDEMKNPSK